MKKFNFISYLLIFLLISGTVYSSGDGIISREIKLKLKEKNSAPWLKDNRQSNLLKGFENILLAGSIHKETVNNNKLYSKATSNSILFQEKKKKSYSINPVKMTILGVVGVGVFTAMHIYYQNTWWKNTVTYFKYAEDGYYARNMDKASHIYTANFFTVASATAYEWTGIEPGKALLYGAITSMAYETYIEVNDGFAPNWGFDWVDMGANIAGALYPFLQQGVKPFRHINFKWSFKPGWIKKKTSDQPNDLLDDYTDMTFWLSVNPMIVLPKSFTDGKYYPNFLAFALGMSLANASHVTGSQNAEAQWYISIDWDINQLPGKSDFMKKLKKILNFYHFPAPAVRISPSGIWYGLYF